jgi:hypothetical protein
MDGGFVVKYSDFVESKNMAFKPCGISPLELNHALKDFQEALAVRSLEQGRFCLWAECGLGKTLMQLCWAHNVSLHTGKPVLIVAPLAVVDQTAHEEGPKFGYEVAIAINGIRTGINITNYEHLSKLDPSMFAGIVLDESSILKSYTGAYKQQIIEFAAGIHYRLACSATPSPNDLMELGNHAEFMGVMTMAEMLATFFTHDGGDTSKWRLKGHVKASKFWKWVSSWAVMIRNPSDIGFDGSAYELPPMIKESVKVFTAIESSDGLLFAQNAKGLSEQRRIARLSLIDRCNAAARLIEQDPDRQWLLWCNLNDESRLLSEIIPDAVEIAGSHSESHRVIAMRGFQSGTVKVLVTKPKIAGFGMNWQKCQRMIYVGLNNSHEQFHQSSRRCHRFGQDKEVIAYLVSHELEGEVINNLERKQKDSEQMAEAMVAAMSSANKWNYKAVAKDTIIYRPTQSMQLPQWLAA